MIRTKYDISISIDDNNFNITVSEANKEQKKTLDNLFEENKDEFSKRDELSFSLQTMSKDFEINTDILKNKFDVSLAKEQKKLNKKISKIQTELKEFDKTATKMHDIIEEHFSKRFELLVSGADKEKLKEEINTKDISYQVVFGSISDLILEEKEKK